MKKEIFFGILWGLTLGLILVAIMFSVPHAAEPEEIIGEIEISISGDSVRVELEKGEATGSVVINVDSLTRTAAGITVDNELLIENGRIFVDGVELTEEELRRLAVDEETSFRGVHHHKGHRQIKRRRLATAYSDGGDLVKFDDIVVDSVTRISGDVVSISGDITVFGEVIGDVVSVFGDIFLKDGAQVRGDVSAPFGSVSTEPGVLVRGQTADSTIIVKKTENVRFDLTPRFNRVEGFTLAPGLTYEDEKGMLPTINISGAYAFTLERWEYDFGIRHKLGKKIGPMFGLRFFQAAETPDRWIFTEGENTIAGLFFKEDFHDFYWARGVSGDAGLFVGKNYQAELTFTAAKISNLKRTAAKAIFGGKKRFRENWSTVLPDSADFAASEGDLKEIGFQTSYDTRDDADVPHSGMLASISYGGTTDSDFDYNLFSGEIKDYIPVARNQTLALRLRGGYSDDYLPLFRRFFLGGIGSLRGYEYKEFEGNRYVLLNADYIWYFYRSDFGAGLFFDTGKTASSGGAFESGSLKSDVGISFLIEDAIRFDLAQRLDDLDLSPVFSARLIALF